MNHLHAAIGKSMAVKEERLLTLKRIEKILDYLRNTGSFEINVRTASILFGVSDASARRILDEFCENRFCEKTWSGKGHSHVYHFYVRWVE